MQKLWDIMIIVVIGVELNIFNSLVSTTNNSASLQFDGNDHAELLAEEKSGPPQLAQRSFTQLAR